MPGVIVIARFRSKAGREDDLRALLAEVQAASREDDGCEAYGYHQAIDDPDALVAVEEWRDEAALAAHLRTPHVQKLIASVPELADELGIAAHHVSASGALPL